MDRNEKLLKFLSDRKETLYDCELEWVERLVVRALCDDLYFNRSMADNGDKFEMNRVDFVDSIEKEFRELFGDPSIDLRREVLEFMDYLNSLGGC